jgi:outer membrane protein insertion porin family
LLDQFGRNLGRTSIGGSQQLIFNNDLIFPIVESIGLKGVVFFDAGNAFLAARGIDLGQMRLASGGGIRWLSPIGPLRIEIGVPLNPRVGDDRQTVMFTFGGPP